MDSCHPGFFATCAGVRLVWRVLGTRAGDRAVRSGWGSWPMFGVKFDVVFGGGKKRGPQTP